MGNYSQNFNLTTQQTTTMRSKASLKFNSLHPESHLKFQNIIRNARLRKNSLEEDLSGNTSDEVSNMLKNKYLSKFREEDDVCMDKENWRQADQQKDLLESKPEGRNLP